MPESGVVSKIARLAERSIRYLESGHGRPIVFLHAFPLSADQWLPQLHRLPPGWRALAPDLRGFRGEGSMVDQPDLAGLTVDRHAADVLAFLANVDVDAAVVVGLSMGGYIAFALLRQAMPRVAALVLANTRATADSAEGLAARDRLISLAEREGVAGVARDMVPKLLGETSRRDQPDLVDAVSRLIEANTVEGIVAATRAMKMRPDSTGDLHRIACPTLIVAGDEDAMIARAEGVAMQGAIRTAELSVLPRCGHLSNLEAPGAFNDTLARFLGRL
jgi:pimeloyl-ACP methyl ester carboxylesterase